MKALAKHILFIVILLMTTSSLKAQQVLSETEQLFSQLSVPRGLIITFRVKKCMYILTI